MKMMVAKNIDKDCAKYTNFSKRGYVACCDGMQRLASATNRTGSLRLDTHVFKNDKEEAGIRVSFGYGSNRPGHDQKFCPFCGEEHAVEVIATVKVDDHDAPDYDVY